MANRSVRRGSCLAAMCVAAWAAFAAAQPAEPGPAQEPASAAAPAVRAPEPTPNPAGPTPAATGAAPRNELDPDGSVDPTKGSSEDSTIDFVSDVRPIFAAHCLDCHGAEKHSGGLRLDSHEGAARGGDSGKPLLGGSLESNELYARVSSSDRTYRMPKNADALSAEELDTIKRWVEQGTPWPIPAPDVSYTFYDEWLSPVADLFKRYETEYYFALPFGLGFLGLLFAVLVVLRTRAAFRRGRAWTTKGRLSGFARFSDRVRTTELLLALLLAAAVVVIAAGHAHQSKIHKQLAVLQEANERERSPWGDTVYGYPPKPVRMDRPKRLTATYYRGNCERSPELFNHGNYLTSIFRVSLCDSEHRPLGVGDAVPPAGVFLRCEIERAPGTTDLLFSPEAMAAVLFTHEHHESEDSQVEVEPTRLEMLEPKQRWVAYVPLEKSSEGPWAGVIYVYTGQVKDEKVHGTLHYGIEYRLEVADDKLTAESDLWMDSFGNSVFAPPLPPGRLPYNEWFSDQPLPMIEGENSKDPKLLGVDEHVQKGLIKPPGESKSPDSPADQPAKEADRPSDQSSSPPAPSAGREAGSTSSGLPH